MRVRAILLVAAMIPEPCAVDADSIVTRVGRAVTLGRHTICRDDRHVC